MIFISECLSNLICFFRSLLLRATHLHDHLLRLRLRHNLTLYDCGLLFAVGLWNARHDQTGVATLCRTTWGHGHHGAGSPNGYLGWQCRNSEENVHVVGIENLRQVTVHFINLKLSVSGDTNILTFIS